MQWAHEALFVCDKESMLTFFLLNWFAEEV